MRHDHRALPGLHVGAPRRRRRRHPRRRRRDRRALALALRPGVRERQDRRHLPGAAGPARQGGVHQRHKGAARRADDTRRVRENEPEQLRHAARQARRPHRRHRHAGELVPAEVRGGGCGPPNARADRARAVLPLQGGSAEPRALRGQGTGRRMGVLRVLAFFA